MTNRPELKNVGGGGGKYHSRIRCRLGFQGFKNCLKNFSEERIPTCGDTVAGQLVTFEDVMFPAVHVLPRDVSHPRRKRNCNYAITNYGDDDDDQFFLSVA